jgi:hypothetical protein
MADHSDQAVARDVASRARSTPGGAGAASGPGGAAPGSYQGPSGIAHRPDDQLRPRRCLPVGHRERPVPRIPTQMQHPIRMIARPARDHIGIENRQELLARRLLSTLLGGALTATRIALVARGRRHCHLVLTEDRGNRLKRLDVPDAGMDHDVLGSPILGSPGAIHRPPARHQRRPFTADHVGG